MLTSPVKVTARRYGLGLTSMPGMRKYRGVCDRCDVELPWRTTHADATHDQSAHSCPGLGGVLAPEEILHMAKRAAAIMQRRISFAGDVEEMAADAAVAGVRAVRSWKPEAGMRLEPYVWIRMRGDIIDGLRRRGHVSRGDMEKVQAARKAGELGYESLDGPARRPVRLDELREVGFDSPDLTATLPFENVDNRDLARWLLGHLPTRQRVGTRTPSEREVIVRCVMNGERLGTVAREFGVTESRICQIKAKALDRLYAVVAQESSAFAA